MIRLWVGDSPGISSATIGTAAVAYLSATRDNVVVKDVVNKRGGHCNKIEPSMISDLMVARVEGQSQE